MRPCVYLDVLRGQEFGISVQKDLIGGREACRGQPHDAKREAEAEAAKQAACPSTVLPVPATLRLARLATGKRH